MGRILVQQWVSADGFAAGPSGPGDIFAAVPDSAASETHNLDLLDGVDEILLGRRTYELFVGHWPTATEPMAPSVNGIPKVVCSTTLEVSPWGAHRAARIVRDGVGHARERRADPDAATIIVWGSLDLVQRLLEAGLVDDLELFVAPILLARGTKLMPADGQPRALTLQELESWPGGVVRMRYTFGAPPEPTS